MCFRGCAARHSQPRVCCATLGCGVKPLRGKDRNSKVFCIYPAGVVFHSPGSRSAPWGVAQHTHSPYALIIFHADVISSHQQSVSVRGGQAARKALSTAATSITSWAIAPATGGR